MLSGFRVELGLLGGACCCLGGRVFFIVLPVRSSSENLGKWNGKSKQM